MTPPSNGKLSERSGVGEGVTPPSNGKVWGRAGGERTLGRGRESRCSRTIDRAERNKDALIESLWYGPGVEIEAKQVFE